MELQGIIDNYEFTNVVLGKGSFAVVKLAIHVPTQEKVAIKIISKATVFSDGQLANQLCREIQALRQCNHLFISKFFDFFEDNNYYYIVQEFAGHGTLLSYVNLRRKLPESQCKKFFIQILSAIEYLHSIKILHRDLKAENVILDSNDNIRLIDFGLCRIFTDIDKFTTTFCGSISYAAPEVIRGEKYSGSADVWAFGVLLYAIANCKLPWDDDNNKKLCQKIVYTEPNYPPTFSPLLIDLLSKMLKKNPEERITISQIKEHPWVSNDYKLPYISNKLNNQEIFDKLQLLGFPKDEVIQNIREGKQTSATTSYEIIKRSKITELLNQKRILQPHIKTIKALSDKSIGSKLPSLNLNNQNSNSNNNNKYLHRISTKEIRDESKFAKNTILDFSKLLNLSKIPKKSFTSRP